MEADVVHIKGLTFTGKGNTNHWVMLDTTEDIGGNGAGTRPVELVLVALGGCTGMDVVSILKKMQQQYDSFELKLNGEVSQEHPKVFKKIHVEYVFRSSGMDEEKVKKAIDLSMDRYCPVTAMLRHSVEITHEFQILPPEQE